MNPDQPATRCLKCGAELPPRLPSGLCPKCLLATGLGSQPQFGPEETVVLPQSAALRGFPQPGEQFGHYRLARLLGQGGMGVVFEAEDLENGRRVALKILSQVLDSPEARKRFLREGQIAASINHPNSVYVFGTEEIAGTPVIAMELVGGGTLRDRVAASGALPVSEAVDAILQIIAGLEAAQQVGVLHRDIKPSNCFIDPDGTIKIGDFGLSISTAVRTESNLTGPGSLFGTPAYSSVEQLRGEELTVRSDIYSVGVTLYYLLTGRLPFEAPNIVQLLVMVLEQRPQSPAMLRAGIPNGLGRAVLHCLNKDPGARFECYAALRRALLPYALLSPSPATLPLRFAAWIIDSLILAVPGWAAAFMILGGFSAVASPEHAGAKWLYTAICFLLTVSYFGLFEGLRGASPGKSLCRLRVVGLGGRVPGISKGLARILIFYGFCGLPSMALTFLIPGQQPADPGRAFAWILPSAIQLLIFCTCRRQNGFAGLHDLWSRTRVISHSAQPIRPVLSKPLEAPLATGEMSQIGPYHVLGDLGRNDDAEVLLGYDARLLRKVWLRRVAPGTPPVATALRHLGRPGRLRWINGQRSNDVCWDAYEDSGGQPLLNLVSTKQDWADIRFWLLDLAEELKAGEKDGSLRAVLSLDRVWIAANGRAKLLDFPAPGIHLSGAVEPPPAASPGEFLRQAALSALQGRPLSLEEARASAVALPLPLYARGFLQRLETATSASQTWAELKPLTGKVPAITRSRRLAMLVISLGLPVFTVAMLAFGSFLMHSKALAGMFPTTAHASLFLEVYWVLPLIFYGAMLVYVVVPSLVGAVDFGGGLAMHALGIAVVGRDGKPTRWRTVRRALIAWLPFLLSPMLVNAANKIVDVKHSIGPALAVLGLATLGSLALRRSLPDRLAGTYLVPKGDSRETERTSNDKKQSWRLPVRIAVLLLVLMVISRFALHSAKPPTKGSTGVSSSGITGAGNACVVLSPDGTPAADASIWVATAENHSLSSFRTGEYYPNGMQKLKPDASGKFNLSNVADDMPVILTDPKGLLVTTAAKARKESRLRLQAFGRVEGILLSEGKPKPGANIDIDLLTETRDLYLNRSATTDQDGEFVLMDLPAGEYRIYRAFFPRHREDESFTVLPSHQRIVTIQEGATLKLHYGGDGRAVIGQAAPENPDIAVDWLNDGASLELAQPSAASGVKNFIRESWGLGQSAADEMKAEREKRSYHLEFEADGSFRAEDVPPGDYELRIEVTKPRPPGLDRFSQKGEVLGSLARKVTIPAGKEPFDLGRQIVSVNGDPASAPVHPLDANLTTVEGKPLRLSSLRGKFVVLVFWASWSEPSREMLADLRTVRDEFGRGSNVEFIAASLDDDAASLRQAAAANNGFTLGRMPMAERASVAETFDVTTLPAVFLLGKDGRIAARDLEVDRLKAALGRALPRP